MDKEKLIDKIKNLQGLTNDEKADLLGLLRSFKKYGLVWEEKLEEVEERLREEIPVLTEVKERAIISDSADAPNHILIEGDNLEALTTLSYTHEGAIDVIYIDPPYNTGNKDFIYNDKFVDAEDEYRHSKWLSFMSKRLRIAKRLLSDKGVIFISIDDNEQAQLKLLCDEIFGESNFVAKFDWRKKTGANDAKDIAIVTESIFLYANHHNVTIESNIWRRDEDSINSERYKFEDEFVAIRGRFYYDTLDRGGLQYSDSMNFGIEAPDGGVIFPNGRDSFVNDGWIWKWGKEKVEWGLKNKFLEFVKSKKSKGSAYTIKYKVYQFVDNEGNIREKSGRAFMNLITEPINQLGNSEMKELFENKTPFSNPKPIGLIKFLLNTIKLNDVKILDFFAGSGTTLHTTMRLNAEDGGNRKCILVTNNENGICENVTYLRNKKVIEGYTTPKGEEVAGLTNNTLRYYRTEFLPRERSPRNMRALVSLATDLLCIKEDLYTEQKMFGKYPTHPKLMRYFANDKKHMLILYKEETVFDIVEEIKNMEFNGKLKIYIFTPGRYPFSDDFFEVQDKVELVALPAAIYDAYTRVLTKRKEKYLTPEKEGETAPLTLFNDNEEGEE